jgi:hypothetical protein
MFVKNVELCLRIWVMKNNVLFIIAFSLLIIITGLYIANNTTILGNPNVVDLAPYEDQKVDPNLGY